MQQGGAAGAPHLLPLNRARAVGIEALEEREQPRAVVRRKLVLQPVAHVVIRLRCVWVGAAATEAVTNAIGSTYASTIRAARAALAARAARAARTVRHAVCAVRAVRTARTARAVRAVRAIRVACASRGRRRVAEKVWHPLERHAELIDLDGPRAIRVNLVEELFHDALLARPLPPPRLLACDVLEPLLLQPHEVIAAEGEQVAEAHFIPTILDLTRADTCITSVSTGASRDAGGCCAWRASLQGADACACATATF